MRKAIISLAVILGLAAAGTAVLAATTGQNAAKSATDNQAVLSAPEQATATGLAPGQEGGADLAAPSQAPNGRFNGNWSNPTDAGFSRNDGQMMSFRGGTGSLNGNQNCRNGSSKRSGWGFGGVFVAGLTLLLIWAFLILGIIALIRHLKMKKE